MTARVLIGFVGDVLVDRSDPHALFDPVCEELHAVDLLFGNQEGVYTAYPQSTPSKKLAVFSAPSNAAALGPAGFAVMSLANNHIADCGHAAMFETAELLRQQGIAVSGIGADITEARAPALAKAGDYEVAVLAYASVFHDGVEAGQGRPGLAPMRSDDVFVPRHPDHYRVPGSIPQVFARLFDEDIAALEKDVRAARERADFVVASFHWGDPMQPFTLTDHERCVGRLAIDAGADLVLGHHTHTLRGMEWYAGKPIFYGLGHFVFDLPRQVIDRMTALGMPPLVTDDALSIDMPGEGRAFLPHEDMRFTMLGWCEIVDGKPNAAGFLPCHHKPDGSVHPCDPSSEAGQEVIDYVRRACAAMRLPVEFETDEQVRIGRFPTVRIRDAAGGDGHG